MHSKLMLKLLCCLLVPAGFSAASNHEAGGSFVRVSPRDPRYLELTDGRPYVPIGLNLIAPDGRVDDEAGGLRSYETWLRQLAANGGNFVRVWLSSGFWDVEHERSGVYDEVKARRIDALLELARRHGIRAKLCLEHFRSLDPNYRQKWSQKLLHRTDQGGPATDMTDFFTGARSREQFRRKLAWLAARFGDNPTVFGWELWNEVNAVAAKESAYLPWTEAMLAELHRLFPRNLAMQSLGSFDRENSRGVYQRHSLLPGNDLAQVHRYLDLGAQLAVCRGPMDVLAADTVQTLLAWQPARPVLLAEGGAVEPSHTGPFTHYARDRAGVLLHDVLFAPFFAGAAGPGHIWHWNHYVDRNNLWHHFARFAAVVQDLDPPAEDFQPRMLAHPRLRIYVLRGRHTVLVWCRDSQNDWRSELADGRAPDTLADLTLDLSGLFTGPLPTRTRLYDPWNDRWTDAQLAAGSLSLPAFSRSIVVRMGLIR
jgi:hypothetical protein